MGNKPSYGNYEEFTENDNSAHLLKFSWKTSVPLILQAEVAECGLASIAMIAGYYGHKLDLAAIKNIFLLI